MCGICGILDPRQHLDETAICAMTTCLRHRGPDGQAIKKLDGAWFGHTRLSVIDLITGNQPMSDPTHRWWIVFNGEIYNYRVLRRELERKGIQFLTSSDTEVILWSYILCGDAMLKRIQGQFAFAIWDQQERILFAARDRFGEKPFYYALMDDSTLLFASEIKSIIASRLIKPRVNIEALASYLYLLYVPAYETVYENIQVLKPGHAIVWRNGFLSEFEYWQPPFGNGKLKITEEDAIHQVRYLIKQAVERQMVADVPVGAFLSGGLDSSTAVALMARYSDQPVKTFSVGFGDEINELPYAATVSKLYKTEHHELHMDIPVAEMLLTMAQVYDEPFADSSNIPTYKIAEFASKHVKVVLAGDGGDEIFGGYGWYQNLLMQGLDIPSKNQIAKLFFQYQSLRVLSRLGLTSVQNKNQVNQILKTARQKHNMPDPWKRHAMNGRYFQPEHIKLLFANQQFVHVWLEESPPDDLQAMDRVFWFDLKQYLPGDILVKVDRAAMAHGLEVRAPFLDVDLVEFVLQLPWMFRLKNNQDKYLLRQACFDLWPQEVQARTKKQGFNLPLSVWLQIPAVKSLIGRVFQPGSALSHIVPGAVSIFSQMNEQQLWSMLCLGLWLEEHSTFIL